MNLLSMSLLLLLLGSVELNAQSDQLLKVCSNLDAEKTELEKYLSPERRIHRLKWGLDEMKLIISELGSDKTTNPTKAFLTNCLKIKQAIFDRHSVVAQEELKAKIEYHLLMGEYHYLAQRFNLAAEHFNESKRLDNNDYRSYWWLLRTMTETARSNTQSWGGDRYAKELEKGLLDLAQLSSAPKSLRAESYAELGNLYIKQKKFAVAAESLQSTLKFDPSHQAAIAFLAQYLFDSKKYEDAEKHILSNLDHLKDPTPENKRVLDIALHLSKNKSLQLELVKKRYKALGFL